MTRAEAFKAAADLSTLVFARTGIPRQQLVCPREKSEMTPCVVRDGAHAVAFTARDDAICVGCEAALAPLVERERARHSKRGQ